MEDVAAVLVGPQRVDRGALKHHVRDDAFVFDDLRILQDGIGGDLFLGARDTVDDRERFERVIVASKSEDDHLGTPALVRDGVGCGARGRHSCRQCRFGRPLTGPRCRRAFGEEVRCSRGPCTTGG